MKKLWNIASEAEMKDFAKDFLQHVKPNTHQATCITLSGELGAGKTTLTKYLALELGIFELVQSPTFVIARFYQAVKNPSWKQLIHIDAYRLEGQEDLLSLRLDTHSKDTHTLIVLEWPEMVLPLPFAADYEIILTYTNDGKGRNIEIK